MLLFWAKHDAASGDWHPWLAHALETGAVCRVLIQRSLSLRFIGFLASQLDVGETEAGNLIVFLAACHDIGKVNPGFQGQIGWHRTRLESDRLKFPERISVTPHGLISAHALHRWFEDAHFFPADIARALASVVGGHHGVLPPPEKWRNLSTPELGDRTWSDARTSMLSLVQGSLNISVPKVPRLPHASAMLIAGLICVADWIASNGFLFPYAAHRDGHVPFTHSGDYFRNALEQSEKAIERLGWNARRCTPLPQSFAELFPSLGTPNPLQEEIFALAKESAGPSLILIEAAMGEGKTEAALSASEIWASTLECRGAYFALPTQATSDQMFSRVRSFLENRAQGDRLALQLLHGHASLSAEFEELRVRGAQIFEARDVGDSPTESVFASAWFTYRKRGLLAAFGVGTVDQVLMAALTGRHVFVRLFGLAGKTVIVDEVHAYDTYMSTLLERLLEWLAAMGSSTLPSERRADLVKAYARGLQLAVPEQQSPVSYPRITALSSSGLRSLTFQSASPHSGKRIRLERIQPDRLGEVLEARLAAGGCTVVVCNTRKDAQRLFRQLEPYFRGTASDGGPELDLFHSHFLFADRDAVEKRCLRRFGKPSAESTRPERAVLIATQVVEQSLDFDFDVMVSAMAPIDLLFQRIGRLHRHGRARPALLAEPTFILIDTPQDEYGLPKFPRGHQSVYEPHLLFRTWLALRKRDNLSIPEDIDSLLDTVYQDQVEPSTLPEAVQDFWQRTRQQLHRHRMAEQSAAQDRYLRSPVSKMAVWELAEPAYAVDDPEQSQFLALTRLTEPSVRVVILEQDSSASNRARIPGLQEPIPLDRALSFDQVRHCLYRSVTLSDRRVVDELNKVSPPVCFRNSPLLNDYRLVMVGTTATARIGNQNLRLDPKLGIVIEDIP
jgi:CRISPR-associated endonuclease/helicase Cas3